MRKVKWHWDYGMYMSFCPYCDEPAYEEDHCVFCKKPYKWVEGKYKPTIIEEGEYTVVQSTNNHIQVLKDGRMVMHSSCTKKKSEQELREMIGLYEDICRYPVRADDEEGRDEV